MCLNNLLMINDISQNIGLYEEVSSNRLSDVGMRSTFFRFDCTKSTISAPYSGLHSVSRYYFQLVSLWNLGHYMDCR